MTLTVDVICPWCYVGKRRLEKAIRALDGGREVQVRWHPFQLNPQMPKEGVSRREYRTRKFGSWERSQELDKQVAAAGEGEGIHFAIDRIERTPNTLDAHRLIWLAGQEEVQDAVVEALFKGYFTGGRDISDRQALLDVVAEAGLDREKAERILLSDAVLEPIRAAEAEARRLGVQSVPSFVVNGELALSGAQEPKAFLAAFEQVSNGPLTSDDGSACTVGLGGNFSC